jgi:Tfp pilus assembly protein PilE
MEETMNKLKHQTGRSMIEMLGVLAIVGILSVGALVGYSMAMANYKANQMISELETIIMDTQVLYEEKANYDGISTALLQSADVLPSKNIIKLDFGATTALPSSASERPGFRINYPIAPAGSTNSYLCQKILTSPLVENSKDKISITRIDKTGAYIVLAETATFAHKIAACYNIQALQVDVRP